MRRILSFGLVGFLASGASACGGSDPANNNDLDSGGAIDGHVDVQPLDTGGGGFDTNPPTLCFYAITPTNAVVKIDLNGSPVVGASQPFKATKNCDGVTDEDVTATTTFTVDDATLGSMAANVFTSATSLPTGVLGKTTQVHTSPGNALANITVIALRTTGDKRDFFFLEPYKLPPEPAKDILKFGTNIKQVDVAFLQDTTASMGPEINNLKNSISDTATGLIAKLKLAIPSVGVAVAHHEDFPVTPFGFPGDSTSSADRPFELYTEITVTTAKAQSAAGLLATGKGGALPESQYEAMYELLTGEGLTWTAPTAGAIAVHTPKAGTTGGVDFRAGSLPVLVEITDASWFDDTTYDTLTAGKLKPHSKTQVIDAFNTKTKAKFVGVHALIEKTGGGADTPCTDYHSPSCDSAQGYKQAIDLAEATKSVVDPAALGTCAAGKCCTGLAGAPVDPDASGKCPLVFQAKGCLVGAVDPSCGTGVSDGIVKAIQAISVGSAFDVKAIPRNDPANPLGADGTPVDAPKAFIKNIRAMDEGDVASGCPAHAATDTDSDGIKDTFTGVTVGTPVCFEVNAKQNDTVEPTTSPQFFNAFIDVIGLPGSIKLDTRGVIFLVPPKEPPKAK